MNLYGARREGRVGGWLVVHRCCWSGPDDCLMPETIALIKFINKKLSRGNEVDSIVEILQSGCCAVAMWLLTQLLAVLTLLSGGNMRKCVEWRDFK